MIKTIDRTHLGKVASELHGYPLAARLASNIIVKYSIDTVLSDLKHFKDIRIDAAKQLIGHTREGLSSEHFDILKILSIADTGLSQYDLTKITHQNMRHFVQM